MKLSNLGIFGVAAVLVASACSSTPGAPAGSQAAGSQAAGGLAIKVGIELPMTGGEAPNGVPTAQGVALALSKLSVPGFNITIEQEDDALNGKHDAPTGAANMQKLANDPQVMFVVGPYNSSVAKAEIPISNAAGMMQCSPANTAVELTKPWGPAKPTDLRPDAPRQDRLCSRGRDRRHPGRRRRRHRVQRRGQEDGVPR